MRAPDAPAGGISGRIAAVIYLGSTVQLHIALGHGQRLQSQVQAVRRKAPRNVGDGVSVAFDPQQSYFIAESTKAAPGLAA